MKKMIIILSFVFISSLTYAGHKESIDYVNNYTNELEVKCGKPETNEFFGECLNKISPKKCRNYFEVPGFLQNSPDNIKYGSWNNGGKQNWKSCVYACAEVSFISKTFGECSTGD